MRRSSYRLETIIMFNSNSSYQHKTQRQQVIALNQSYPCPRCNCGVLEPFGHTETFQCSGCSRCFVPLNNGRKLYPANRMGWKIASTYWWDGLRWNWAGTTASAFQLLSIVMMFITPMLTVNLLMTSNVWTQRPEWVSPLLMTAVVGLVMAVVLRLLCWDFDIGSNSQAANSEIQKKAR